jgi:hypothetical protein
VLVVVVPDPHPVVARPVLRPRAAHLHPIVPARRREEEHAVVVLMVLRVGVRPPAHVHRVGPGVRVVEVVVVRVRLMMRRRRRR